MNYLEKILEELKKDGHFEKPCFEKKEVKTFGILDLIEEFGLSFNLGTVVAHIITSDNDLDKLETAKFYLDREIARIEAI